MGHVICLEGIDVSGKSTIAKQYEAKGYKIVHMSAPDKRYANPGYTGPSYADDLVEMYMENIGQNVVYDRTSYGELIWPEVYGRKAMLTDEDHEMLGELLDTMDVQKFLLVPKDSEAHWNRCVDRKEQITRRQFGMAKHLYNGLVDNHGFIQTDLEEFSKHIDTKDGQDESISDNDVVQREDSNSMAAIDSDTTIDTASTVGSTAEAASSTNISTLERANAINTILQKRIVTKKGDAYEKLDDEIRVFLQKELDSIFTVEDTADFSEDEVQILKVFVNRLKQKQANRV